ncbi:folylpolyglutamate synthase, mitochondrial-like isoform X2 [Ruditapes philippinarum]|uniref:folylpolyglutamate synthase, mitochondrial-like isoform X2 n=1 Tax=Ruditapes philippinarum TaxID=129788 RepID=UPI00295A70E2|nr:folylpolyglutamate synthase, mitochondrial-like isoform X2 [Ruditapes philippinarum]
MVRTVASAVVKGDNSKYEEAVKTLNTLQTNAQTLEKIRQERDKRAHLNVPRMWKYAERIGIQEKDVDKLNVIHVSGTKGKGSTCAFCESLLRHHGYKTGFFSSPHLIEVRERFSLNGAPLEKDKFAAYFWEVYNKLDKTKGEHDGLMPNYFGFLTVMALHVFLKEQVDVAILEVGIGGQYDCTNMVRNPVVCGVSSLGLDHTSILGTSIDKIAWHKAGIFKPGVPSFTVPQCESAMSVIKERAAEIGAPLSVCPDIRTYGEDIKLGIKGSIQVLNASLSLQLCNTWIQKIKEKSSSEEVSDCGDSQEQTSTSKSNCDIKIAEAFQLTPQHLAGLAQCQWLGRNQTIREPGITYYLDGAHTVESIQQCVDWFSTEANLEKARSKHGVYRVLIFNTTGDRETTSLLSPLLYCNFDAVLFCPNVTHENAVSADQTNNTVTKESQLKRCILNKETWDKQIHELGHISKNNNICNGDSHIPNGAVNAGNETVENGLHCDTREVESHALPTISHCVHWVCQRSAVNKENRHLSEKCVEAKLNGQTVEQGCGEGYICEKDSSSGNNGYIDGNLDINNVGASKGDPQVQVLVTGSMHLVGGALKVLWNKE